MASHLTFEERQVLYRLNKAKRPKTEIAGNGSPEVGGKETAPPPTRTGRRRRKTWGSARRRALSLLPILIQHFAENSARLGVV